MRFRKYKIQFKYQGEADVLVLQSEVDAPLLRRALSRLRCSELHIGQLYFVFRPRYIFWFLRYWCSTSKSVATVCAHIRSHRIRTVVGMDFLDVPIDVRHPPRPLITESSKLLKNVCFFTVQHGWQWMTRPNAVGGRGLTLLSFGTRTADDFPIYGRTECQFVPIGSLALSNYLSVRPIQKEKSYQICLVSSIRNEKFFDHSDERSRAFVALVELYQDFLRRSSVTTIVALNNRGLEVNRELERSWFASRFGAKAAFTDPSQKFGGLNVEFDEVLRDESDPLTYPTYYASDVSNVTVGGTSTVLWESFARGNKVLAVNMTNSDNFDFPEPGIWSMRNPSAAEFEERLNEILAIDTERWLALTGTARERVVMSDSHISTAAERLAMAIQRAVEAI